MKYKQYKSERKNLHFSTLSKKSSSEKRPAICELALYTGLFQLPSSDLRDLHRVASPAMTSGGAFKGAAASAAANGASASTSASETAVAVAKFRALGVCEQLAEAAAALGWTAPTEIQAAAVPHLLAGAWLYGGREKEDEKERWHLTATA